MRPAEVPLGCVVLAGGRSVRMGRDKAGLDWHGQPLVAHVAAVLRDATGGGPLAVAGPAGPPPDWAAALPAGTTLLADPAPDAGPVEGLRTALAALRDRVGLVLVAGTDQPLLTPATFAPLLAVGGPAAFRTPAGLQPLGAVHATTPPAPGVTRLRDLLDGATVLEADAATTEALRSLDTPEALAAASRV